MAASLMLSGVSKSGSPADSEITSRPLAFSSRAFVAIPMVWEGEMRFTLSAKKPMACLVGSQFSPRPIAKRAEPTLVISRVKVKTGVVSVARDLTCVCSS